MKRITTLLSLGLLLALGLFFSVHAKSVFAVPGDYLYIWNDNGQLNTSSTPADNYVFVRVCQVAPDGYAGVSIYIYGIRSVFNGSGSDASIGCGPGYNVKWTYLMGNNLDDEITPAYGTYQIQQRAQNYNNGNIQPAPGPSGTLYFPRCTLSMSPSPTATINSGQSIDITWSTQNCNYANIRGGRFGSGQDRAGNTSYVDNTGSLNSDSQICVSAAVRSTNPNVEAFNTVTKCLSITVTPAPPATIRVKSPDISTNIQISGGFNACDTGPDCQNIYGTRDIMASPYTSTAYTISASENPGYNYPPSITSTPGFAEAGSGYTSILKKITGNIFKTAEASTSCPGGGATCTLGPGDSATFTVRYTQTPTTPPPQPSTCNIDVRGYLDGTNQATDVNFTLTKDSSTVLNGYNGSALSSFSNEPEGIYTISYPSSTNVNGTTYNYSSSDPTTISCSSSSSALFTLRYQSSPGAVNCVVNSFTASPSTITQGDYSTLNWSVNSATSLTVDGIDEPQSGSLLRGPFQSTRTYQLVGQGSNGGSCSASVTVTVNGTPPPSPPPPGSCTIDYFPNDNIYNGQAFVQWQTTGTSSLSLSGGPFGGGTSVEADGSRTISLSQTTQFTLTGTAPGGSACSGTAWMFYNDTPPPPPPPQDPCEIRMYGYFNGSFAYTGINYSLTGPATYWGEDRGYGGFGNPITGVVPGTYTINYPNPTTVSNYLSDMTGSDPTTVYCPSGGIARFYLKYQSRPVLNIRP